MELKASIKDVLYDKKRKLWYITFITKDEVNESLEELDKKDLDLQIRVHRKKRSLDANSYFWLLVSKIANKLNISKEETYIDLLKNYGVYTPIVVRKTIVNKIISKWRYVQVLGDITVGNESGVQLLCYFGSSSYDTKEMARLIDGAVNEAKNLGIETLSFDEIEHLKVLWKAKDFA